jgi:predicted phage terminase large subunit-like protein
MEQEKDNPDTDKWKVISFPAILDENLPTERSMWPGFWPLKNLKATRSVLPVSNWKGQYQQEPTSEQGAILKRDYWRIWGTDLEVDLKEGKNSCPGPQHAVAWRNLDPPACDFVLQSWDCAASKNDRSHPSAFTEWGVFQAEDPKTGKTTSNIFLLSAFKARMLFPELKAKAKQFYEETQPDSLLIENKSAGMQLLQEFRAMGIPAQDFAGSSRGTKAMPNDKIARANLVADIFASGYVWAPDRRFAEEVIMQCADFPSGEEDDLVDSTVQALLRFRAGGLIRTEHDEEEERDQPRARRRRMY